MYQGLRKYIFIIVLLFLLWSLVLGYFPFLNVLCLLFVFIVSFIISFFAMRNNKISCHIPSIVERDASFSISFHIQNHNYIHCSKAIVQYQIRDNSNQIVLSSRATIGDIKKSQELTMSHNGYYKLYLEKVYYFDILQCLFIKKKIDQEISFFIFPNITEVEKYLIDNTSFSLESNEYDMYHKGDDFSEVFEIRKYNEFDSLKHIHWKASMKKDELFVKVGSQPIMKRLLLAIELCNHQDKDDQALDNFYSLCLSLIGKNIDYEIICPSLDKDEYHVEHITNDNHFKDCLKRILQTSNYNINDCIQSIHNYTSLYIINDEGIEVRKI